jgi:hypothetical protein
VQREYSVALPPRDSQAVTIPLPTQKPGTLPIVLTVFGASAVTFMMLMYAMERRHDGFVLAFACGCALSSAYGFLAGTWPFGVVEAVWTLVAVHRFANRATKPF